MTLTENMSRVNFLRITHPQYTHFCRESTSSQPPLKRFQLLAQDMMEHSSAAAITVSNTVDSELIAYSANARTIRKQWT